MPPATRFATNNIASPPALWWLAWNFDQAMKMKLALLVIIIGVIITAAVIAAHYRASGDGR